MEGVIKATAAEFDENGGFRGFAKLPSFAGDSREHWITSHQLQTNKQDLGGFAEFNLFKGRIAPLPDKLNLYLQTPEGKYAFKELLKSAVAHDKLSRGLMNTIKALEKKEALLCILAENCDEIGYKKRIQALCQEHSIPLVMVPDNMRLGRIAAFRMLDTQGNKIKGVPCSSMVVRSNDWKWSTDKGAFIIEWLLKKKPLL
jgi:small subunit ribosomal protein S12e